MTPIELQQRGMEILIRELGYADASRFILQFFGARRLHIGAASLARWSPDRGVCSLLQRSGLNKRPRQPAESPAQLDSVWQVGSKGRT